MSEYTHTEVIVYKSNQMALAAMINSSTITIYLKDMSLNHITSCISTSSRYVPYLDPH